MNIPLYPIKIVNPFYALSVTNCNSGWSIQGEIFQAPLTTHELPFTYGILLKYLPQILTATCFNDKNLPFSKELRNTETGHLLEHILLEFLCDEKLESGASNAAFNGVTRWYKDEPEKFEIMIEKDGAEDKYLFRALPKGLSVFNRIVQSPMKQQSYQSIQYSYNDAYPRIAFH